MNSSIITLRSSVRLLAKACCIPLLACVLSFPVAVAENESVAKEKLSGPMMRILCVGSLSENEEIILASKTEDGKWVEHGTITLRSSFITPWMKITAGAMNLTRREADGLVSIGSFKIADNIKRAILVLLPNAAKKSYQVDVIDPETLGFRKGMALVTNYSSIPATVMLGSKRTDVKPGQRITEQAVVGKDGMYRMLVGYQNGKKELIPCYDRYISANSEARDFLLLFPDTTAVLKVYSLSEFGPFE